MFSRRVVLVCTFVLLALGADAARGEPAAKDLHGDPLPPGAAVRLGTVRFRHDSTVVFATFLPGDRSVLSLSDDGVLCVWELPSGRQIRRVESVGGPAAGVTGASLSPDGKYLTAFCDDGFLRIWSWADARELGKVAQAARVGKSTRAASSAFRSSSLAQALSQAARASEAPVYSRDGKTLLLFGGARGLQLLDLPNGKEIGPSPGHTEGLVSITFTPEGDRVLTKDGKGTRIWDAATGKELGTFAVRVPATAGRLMVSSPDGRFGLAAPRIGLPAAQGAPPRGAVVFDTATGRELGTIQLDVIATAAARNAIRFSPDGRVLAACTGEMQQLITLYEIPGGKQLRTLEVEPPPAAAPGAFPGRGVRFARGSTAPELLFSPGGRLLAYQGSSEAPIAVLDTATGKRIASLPEAASGRALLGLFSPDGRCLALEKSDGTVTLYEVATGHPRRTYGGGLPPFPTPRSTRPPDPFGARGFRGASVSEPPEVRFAFSPDGRLLATPGAGDTVHVWDVVTGKELTVLKGHTGPVNALTFAPNGKTLASASHDTTALIWDVTGVRRPAGPARSPTPGDLEQWWQALAEEDAAKAAVALGELVTVPTHAVAWIRERVRPAPPLDAKRVGELVRRLDDDEFEVREKAEGEILALGGIALPVIEKALAGQPTPEARRRLADLRGKLTQPRPQGDTLRIVRAMEALEQIRTPEARRVLQALGEGAPGALVTTAAREALER